ncbi:PREDICTED: 39S ribosomal protein L18, mitochondrial [Aptenodytes forsteri]|uniref:39S ribosomal protein L18, mitochondrial n=1 Tax=Aptenodytes forsteri TaxID=9233 RepID=UPI0004F41387|nr:PREDICTED: 39S ribosomal protein L18, mitochondrial [Aptenodytes forsteri]
MARGPQGMLGTHPPPGEGGGTGDGPPRARGGTTPPLPNPGARYGPASSRDWCVPLNKAATPREGQEDFQEVLEGSAGSRACALAASPRRGAARERRKRTRVAFNAGLRFASTTASLRTETEVDTSENEIVASDFTNRNPRNLEQLALARKERGWKTTWPKREFWHRLRLERTQHYVEAFVERCNGDVVVSASTREWAIKRHLYSPKGVTACKNLGRVMAQRCLEAGINFVNFKAVIPWEHRCDSIQEFEKAVEEGGVVLREPRRIYR